MTTKHQTHPTPWNHGRLIGPKPPLKPKHIWALRTRLQHEGRTRDLAMFNLAIDSKLRGATSSACGSPTSTSAMGSGCERRWCNRRQDGQCLSS